MFCRSARSIADVTLWIRLFDAFCRNFACVFSRFSNAVNPDGRAECPGVSIIHKKNIHTHRINKSSRSQVVDDRGTARRMRFPLKLTASARLDESATNRFDRARPTCPFRLRRARNARNSTADKTLASCARGRFMKTTLSDQLGTRAIAARAKSSRSEDDRGGQL